jgi:hypothetical protein
MNTCLTCKAPLDDINYRFCGISCQFAYIEVKEKNVKHTFTTSQLNPKECATCRRGIMDHLRTAKCESCDAIGECNVIDNILMCESCEREHLLATKEVIETKIADAQSVIAEAKKIDSTIRYNGDFFNAKTIAIAEIKETIWKDDSIPKEEKQFKFQSVIAARYENLKQVIFKLDEQKHDATVEQLAITKTLRDLGTELRDEIRAKIKEVDSTYVPVKIKPKIKAAKKTPMDRMIEALALMKNISHDEAAILIKKGVK